MMKSSTPVFAAILLLTAAVPATAQRVSATQLDVSAVPDMDHDAVRRVQRLLQQRGFSPGPLDGVDGPLTKTAIRGFQKTYGMKTSGEIDNQLLLALGAVDLTGGSR
jgi:peptidoglycan hydrolase-like protein with peptidoglycan-binding domain